MSKVVRYVPEEMYLLNTDDFIDYLINTFSGDIPISEELDFFINKEIDKHLEKSGKLGTPKHTKMTDQDRIEVLNNIDSYSPVELDEILYSFEDWIYEVEIKFLKYNSIEKIKKFLSRNLEEYEVISLSEGKAKITWSVEAVEGPHEIENRLHYVLENGSVGTYSYRSIN